MARSNAIEVLHLVADHGKVTILCISADHLFSDLHVQKSYLGGLPFQKLRFPVEEVIVCQSDRVTHMPSVITRLDIEADEDSFERWEVCCSSILGHVFRLAEYGGRGAGPICRVATALHLEKDQRREGPVIRSHNLAVWLRRHVCYCARWFSQPRDSYSSGVFWDSQLGLLSSKARSAVRASVFRLEKQYESGCRKFKIEFQTGCV